MVLLVTSSPANVVEPLLSRRTWKNLFKTVVTGDKVQRSKPQPDIYLLALELAGADSANSLALEDSVNGVRAARAAGMNVLSLDREKHAARRQEAGGVRIPEFDGRGSVAYW